LRIFLLTESDGCKIQRFTQLYATVNSDNVLRSEAYLRFCNLTPQWSYHKSDFIFRSGNWRNENVGPLVSKLLNSSGLKICLGHSDKLIGTSVQILLKALGPKSIWGTNLKPLNGFSRSLPLGLTNPEKNSDVHALLSNDIHLLEADSSSEFPDRFTPELYANFSLHHNKKVRADLNEYLRRTRYIVRQTTPSMTSSGRVAYLRQLRESPMVLCPEGNGVDTHRLWETLYMGGIPVMLENPALDDLVEGLPVIRLRAWEELDNMSAIEELWDAAVHRSWNQDRLLRSYWQREMES
jgi:hypothetical protein